MATTSMGDKSAHGFTTAVGVGGDPIIGTTHIDCLAAFEAESNTDAAHRALLPRNYCFTGSSRLERWFRGNQRGV